VAALQLRNESWRFIFRFKGQQYFLTIGKVEEIDAQSIKARYEHILRLLKQHLLTLPAGMNICTFLQYDGKPPDSHAEPEKRQTTFAEFRESYVKTISNGAIEENTLDTTRIHLNHFEETLGKKFPMNALALADLQRHVNCRQQDVAATTIKKEIDTLRAAWKWAERMAFVEGGFPSRGLVYPKSDDKLPFMTWAEIERRIAAGGSAGELWECLYLTVPEVSVLLEFVKQQKVRNWIYPMFLFAAHTGARRSEMMRARVEDVDLASGVVTVREKKRVKGRRTTRRIPLSTQLAEVLSERLRAQVGKPYLFGAGLRLISPQTAQKAFVRVLKGSKWDVLKGWHVLRHSFISALASRGVDQRIIDDFVGHQTDEQRRRYRHLYPSTQKQAIDLVWG
jgi:integrase